MSIKITNTSFPDLKIIHGVRHHDERGFFAETYKESEYLKAGVPRFVQDNMSESSKGVIRGLHWQEAPFGQGKLVTCVSGSIYDVAVDIRKNSEFFGKYFAIQLDSRELTSLWIPEGFAHGFQALSDDTVVHYKVTNYWSRDHEKSLNCLDPLINIAWPLGLTLISSKDSQAPRISEI